MADPELDQELDHLYARPLAEFITARNELAKRLRSGGDRETADEIKALAKPSMTAWAVNALFHHQRDRFDELLAAAAAVRAALTGDGDRRTTEAARRKALQALLGRAAKILVAAGHAATPANRQRIGHTLEALAARDPASGGPRAGRLTGDLEPQGFDVLAGLAASLAASGPSTQPSPGSTQRPGKKRATGATTAAGGERLAAARRKVEEQEEALARLEREVEETAAVLGEAAEQHERRAEEAAEAARRAEGAAEAAAAAKSALAAARTAAAKAKAARKRGLARLDTARRQLERRQG